MKRVRWFAVAAGMLAASLLGAQLHPFGDPQLFARGGPEGAGGRAAIPDDVRGILATKCADCHSSETRPPIYGHFAPASWLVERDVVEARRAMNLSQWAHYSPEEQQALRAKIALMARQHAMPPAQYLAVHWNARLSSAEVGAMVRWAGTAQTGGDPVTAAASAPLAGDAERGRTVFEKRCTGCHALAQNREGPRLRDVYGRTAGTATGYDFSDALAKSHIVWNEATLDRWLSDPDTMVPGNNMDFYVARAQERADVIRFLREQAGQ